MENVNEGRSQIKRQYGQYSKIRVNEKAPIRNKVLNFVGKRFVTEEEMLNQLSTITEEIGKEFDQRKWFKNNQKYFESFENRGQKVLTLSKYGKRVHEFINKPKEKTVNENVQIGLFKKSLFEQFVNESVLNEGTMAAKAFKDEDLYDGGKLENAWDSDWKSFADIVTKKLGAKSATDVIQADENSEEETDLGGKIYDFLQKKFKPTEEFENDFVDADYDSKLNVVRTSDMGFVAYQFVASSKF